MWLVVTNLYKSPGREQAAGPSRVLMWQACPAFCRAAEFLVVRKKGAHKACGRWPLVEQDPLAAHHY